jgi:DinB family protein
MTHITQQPATPIPTASPRAEALATRLEDGARALIAFALSLSDAEWRTPMPHDGRTLGVIVHHVASVYPIEVQLAQTIAAGQPVTGVTPADIDAMNAEHATKHAAVTKDVAVDLLRHNSAAAAAAIRALTEEQLASAAPVSLYADAPLTCQFVLEDHAVRHSYHHLARIRRVVGR